MNQEVVIHKEKCDKCGAMVPPVDRGWVEIDGKECYFCETCMEERKLWNEWWKVPPLPVIPWPTENQIIDSFYRITYQTLTLAPTSSLWTRGLNTDTTVNTATTT